ncbi:hypothetical protein EC973_004339 [Apophysomyces ossiformis]|uniref:N-acetyltransferase domain-containing protein n=1 Tax=Apophysomyces ossiformis TaxID=679940 RepID=A0A8H7EMI7_9FUNG|nr:hypothetical protein EC973_004339 [Apophysomyces ossiformis]
MQSLPHQDNSQPLNSETRKRSIQIRDGNVSDAHAIVYLGSYVFTQTFGHSLSKQDLETYLKETYTINQISTELKDPLKYFVVASDSQNNIVGFAQLTQGTMEECVANSDRPIELQRIYVHPDYHGAGIGRRLVEKVEKMAQCLGFRTLWLGVWEENFKAQGVYQKLGYKKVGSHDFVMGECVQTDYILSKSI